MNIIHIKQNELKTKLPEENSIMIYNQKYKNYNRLNHNKIQEIKAHKKIYKII